MQGTGALGSRASFNHAPQMLLLRKTVTQLGEGQACSRHLQPHQELPCLPQPQPQTRPVGLSGPLPTQCSRLDKGHSKVAGPKVMSENRGPAPCPA